MSSTFSDYVGYTKAFIAIISESHAYSRVSFKPDVTSRTLHLALSAVLKVYQKNCAQVVFNDKNSYYFVTK